MAELNKKKWSDYSGSSYSGFKQPPVKPVGSVGSKKTTKGEWWKSKSKAQGSDNLTGFLGADNNIEAIVGGIGGAIGGKAGAILGPGGIAAGIAGGTALGAGAGWLGKNAWNTASGVADSIWHSGPLKWAHDGAVASGIHNDKHLVKGRQSEREKEKVLTEQERIDKALLGATPATQALGAEYDTLKGQIGFQKEELERQDLLKRQSIADLAESNRIKQALALYGAGVGGSGAASQQTQDLSVREARTLGDWREQVRAKRAQQENFGKLKSQEFRKKIWSDKSFTSNVSKPITGDGKNSFSFNRQYFDMMKKVLPNVTSGELMKKTIFDKIASSVKDQGEQQELLDKFEDNYTALVQPFLEHPNVETNINTRNGDITYYNQDNGTSVVVSFDKNNIGEWQPKPRIGGVSQETISKFKSNLPNINTYYTSNSNLSNPIYGFSTKQQTYLKKNGIKLIINFIKKNTKEGYSKYKSSHNIGILDNVNTDIQNLTSNYKDQNNINKIYDYFKRFLESNGI